ncbi:hypothetical protein [Sphingomonas sabuli]|nr:hypothetical protein [Sphingomonas sabuli]
MAIAGVGEAAAEVGVGPRVPRTGLAATENLDAPSAVVEVLRV